MKCENFVCYKKDNKIYSMGVNINNRIANMPECLINREHSKTNLFHHNLGIPLPLVMIKNDGTELIDFIQNGGDNSLTGGSPKHSNKKKSNTNKNKKDSSDSILPIDLLDKLINLRQTGIKNKRHTRKRRNKNKRRKTRKNLFTIFN